MHVNNSSNADFRACTPAAGVACTAGTERMKFPIKMNIGTAAFAASWYLVSNAESKPSNCCTTRG
jgi:hypothetical protein